MQRPAVFATRVPSFLQILRPLHQGQPDYQFPVISKIIVCINKHIIILTLPFLTLQVIEYATLSFILYLIQQCILEIIPYQCIQRCSILNKKKKRLPYLFIFIFWLHRVFVAAHGHPLVSVRGALFAAAALVGERGFRGAPATVVVGHGLGCCGSHTQLLHGMFPCLVAPWARERTGVSCIARGIVYPFPPEKPYSFLMLIAARNLKNSIVQIYCNQVLLRDIQGTFSLLLSQAMPQ